MHQQVQLYFAPFQGITTHTFRDVYSRHFSGIDKLFTPYFANLAVGLNLPSKKIIALRNQTENGTEVIPQILSKDADEIIWFAHNCQKMGFKELNWNLGCPYPQVANKKRGSGLLLFPEMIDDILQKAMPQIKIPFSIKCRLGYNSSEELSELVPIFNAYPISEVIVHARTGRQMYSGQTDREAFARIAPQIASPRVYNGDIFSKQSFLEFRASFPEISLLMLGRGILSDPFLPAKIKGLDIPANPKAQIRIFMDDLYYAYRKEKNDHLTLLNVMKEYWTYLSQTFDDPIKVFRKLKKCKRFNEYEDAVHAVFAEHDLIDSL